jgi:ABC-2 type transport system permease protein
VSPLTILFFIYVFAGPQKVIFALGGGLVAVIVGSCITLETEAAFMRLVSRLQDMFVSSPISPVTYVTGLSLAMLWNGLGGIVIFSILLGLYVHLDLVGWLVITVASIITWASISALGFTISTFARDVRDLWVYTPLLNVLLAFLPPVFYPITILPEMLRTIAELVPTTHAATLIRSVMGMPTSGSQLFVSWLALPAFTLVFLSLALLKAKWRET